MILELVAKRGRALVGARTVLIELVSGNELVVAAVAGDRPAGLIGERMALADSVASAALRTRVTHRLEAGLSRARFDQHGFGKNGVSVDAGMVVPLIFHDQAYGVLVVVDRLQDGPEFTAEDQGLLEAFAMSAATAVATARTVSSELHRHRIAAAEGERGRWARELHDETLQSLAALRIALSTARRVGGVQVLNDAVVQAIEDLDDGISKPCSLVTDLRPVALDDLGLAAAIEALCERASRHGLEIDRSIDLACEQGREQTRHTPEFETAAYRIIEEALTNATKHGQAKRAVIELLETDATVELIVRDDGLGFDPAASTTGFGLLGMSERVELLAGAIQVESSPGNGTTLTASFPVQRRSGEAATATQHSPRRTGTS